MGSEFGSFTAVMMTRLAFWALGVHYWNPLLLQYCKFPGGSTELSITIEGGRQEFVWNPLLQTPWGGSRLGHTTNALGVHGCMKIPKEPSVASISPSSIMAAT